MTPSSTSKTLHADQEHSGIRVTVPLVLVVAGIVVFLVAYLVLEGLPPGGIGDYAGFLSCVTALLVGLGVAALVETWLKRTWHSGRRLVLDDRGIQIEVPGRPVIQLEAAKRFSQLCWHFTLKGYPKGGRERRVASSWLCLACQVQQDDERFIVYTFMPPKKAADLTGSREFHEIRPADYFEGSAVRNFFRAPSRPPLPSNVLAGKEGPYWVAERRRWEEGLELTAGDFQILMGWLEEYRQL